MKNYIILLVITTFNLLQADEFEFIEKTNTLSYQARQIAASQNHQNIPILVRDAVDTVYQAYKPEYDNAIRKVKGDAGRRGQRGGVVTMQINNQIYPLIEVIINQIDIIAQKLSHEEKQQFWTHAADKISSTIENYSTANGGSTDGIKQRVSNLINLKKIIG